MADNNRVPDYDLLSHRVIGACIEVHRHLGPGLLESAYEECLCREFSLRGLRFQRQLGLPVEYKGVHVACGFRTDFNIEERLILEVKAVNRLHPVHEAQLLTYLKLTGIEVGLLVNFNVRVLRSGVVRRILSRGRGSASEAKGTTEHTEGAEAHCLGLMPE